MKRRNKAYRTWLEIDVRAIARNTKSLISLLREGGQGMVVVKSNAYGHGLVASARAAITGGADWLAVDEISEAVTLRESGIKTPILVLGFTVPEMHSVAATKNISLTISSLEMLRAVAASRVSRKLKVHLKIDTGLHRQGILVSDVVPAIKILTSKGWMARAILEGVYTHFAAMEDPRYEKYSRMQVSSLMHALELIREKGMKPLVHASASSGIMFSSDFHFDIARAGIAVYGLWPSPEICAHMKKTHKNFILTPALSWKTIITEVKRVPKGSRIGYDLTYTTKRDARIAVIPVGYWHGIPRSASNTGSVLVRGVHVPIIGRVSMDMTIIDVTGVPSVTSGDEVVLIGPQKKETISAEDFARAAGTINYEAVTRINPLIPRIYLP